MSTSIAHRVGRKGYGVRLGAALALLVALLAVSPGVGTESSSIGWWDAWRARLGVTIAANELAGRPLADLDGDGAITEDERACYVILARTIGFSQRFSRSLLALQVGMTLALCGATFQVLFRNPLATPYTLGVAGGGSLGALIALRIGWVGAIVGVSTMSVAAFAGAVGVVSLVLLMARGARRLTSNELLLAGVTLGLFCSAMMVFVTAVSNERVTFVIVRWMMGSLDPLRTVEGAVLFPMIVPSWVVLIFVSSSLNQYRLGDELAASRGVHVASLQIVCVAVCSLATAAIVAHCGPIGFVGLVVPHIAGFLVGSDCRVLLPASAIIGGAFVILCDWASQVSMRVAGGLTGRHLGSATLPIGVVTAIVGVPIFLLLLRRRLRR